MAPDTVQTRRRATYDDLLRGPDTMVAEIIDGEPYLVLPEEAARHYERGVQVLELDSEIGMPSQGEVGLDPLLERREPNLLEARDLRLREVLVHEIRQR